MCGKSDYILKHVYSLQRISIGKLLENFLFIHLLNGIHQWFFKIL